LVGVRAHGGHNDESDDNCNEEKFHVDDLILSSAQENKNCLAESKSSLTRKNWNRQILASCPLSHLYLCPPAISRTRSRITSAMRGSLPTAALYQTRLPCFSVGLRHVGWPLFSRVRTTFCGSPRSTGISSQECSPSLIKKGTITIFLADVIR